MHRSALLAALLVAGLPDTASVQDAAIEKRLCDAPSESKSKVCRLAELKAAGRDAHGRELLVAKLARATAADFEAPHRPCLPYEYDLVVRDGEAIVLTQLLSYVCNDGLASEGCGEGQVRFTIGENRFEREYEAYYGCRPSRSHDVFQLSPLKRLSQDDSSEQPTIPSSEGATYDWQTYDGRMERSQEIDAYDDDAARQKRIRARYGAEARSVSVWIPELDLGEAYSARDWRTLALGSCAALVDGVDHGFLVSGAGAASARFRVLATARRELIVEVADDRILTGARSWLYDDHLELWLAPSFSWDEAFGADAAATVPVPRQWGIRVSDGKVFPAHGNPKEPLAVERQEGKGAAGRPVVRFRIPIPSSFGAAPLVTVAYSDTEDGRRQERVLATSELKFGRAWTLGTYDAPPRNRVRCEAKGGVLDFRDAQTFDTGKSAISQ